MDEVRLVGSFNQTEDGSVCLGLVKEAMRILRPGGSIHVHGLMADKPFPNGEPKLKGLALLMKRIAVVQEIPELLKRLEEPIQRRTNGKFSKNE